MASLNGMCIAKHGMYRGQVIFYKINVLQYPLQMRSLILPGDDWLSAARLCLGSGSHYTARRRHHVCSWVAAAIAATRRLGIGKATSGRQLGCGKQNSSTLEGEVLACLRHGDSTARVLTRVEPGEAQQWRREGFPVAGCQRDRGGGGRRGVMERSQAMRGRSIGIVHPRSVASPIVRGGPRGIPAAELSGAREDACEVRKLW
jgi:hypothetical protein